MNVPEPSRTDLPLPSIPEDCLHSQTTIWATLDPSSEYLRAHLDDAIDALLDRGVEMVGFHGAPDALGLPGWEKIVYRFFEAGFQCLLSTSFPLPLRAEQAAVLSRMDEIRVPPAEEESKNGPFRVQMSLRAVFQAAARQGIHPPRIISAGEEISCPGLLQPPGHTRDCLDPWEGVVLGASGETFPCSADGRSLGDHRASSLSDLLEGRAIRQRRAELLGGALASPCAACRRSGWISLESFRERVSGIARRRPRPSTFPTAQELNGLFSAWASDGRRLLLYPAGNRSVWLIQYARGIVRLLVGFGDRDPAKQALRLLDRPVLAPEQISPEKVDVVLIAAGPGEAEIYQSLLPLRAAGIQLVTADRLGRIRRRMNVSSYSPLHRFEGEGPGEGIGVQGESSGGSGVCLSPPERVSRGKGLYP